MSGKVFARQDQGGIGGGFEALVPGTSQAINVSSASVQCTAFSQLTSLVRLFGTVDCYLAFGVNPVVTPSSAYFLPGGIVDFVGVPGGSQIAVANSSVTGGTLFITEGS